MKNILCYLFVCLIASCAERTPKIKLIVNDEKLATIDDRLFGQFLEKPSWHGEGGPEAALVPGTHELQEGALELMKGMNIPVLRFPGGSDVEHVDWTTMVDYAMDEKIRRPAYVGKNDDTVSADFGYDEAGKLAEELGAELILVVNFGDAYHKRKSLEEAIAHESGLIAYCALEAGVDLPGDLEKWTELRVKNGHPEPYPVKYIQIANEPWVMSKKELPIRGEIAPGPKEHYLRCLEAYIDAFRQLAPGLKIIADGNCEGITTPLRDRFGEKIDYLALHYYKPWKIRYVKKHGVETHRDSLSDREIFQGWASVPEIDSNGFSVLDNNRFRTARGPGYPIAMTEWNWNGWWNVDSTDPDNLGSYWAKGVGAAGFLHAMMRSGDFFHVGIQSMLVGNSWGITAIRVSPDAAFKPYPIPTGQVTALYSNYHGNDLLKLETVNIPTYNQPFDFNGIAEAEKVAYLDAICTRGRGRVYFHIINRHFTSGQEVELDLSALDVPFSKAVMRSLAGNYDNDDPCSNEPFRYACLQESELECKDEVIFCKLPPRSVSVIEVIEK